MKRGDVYWATITPRSGSEQRGRRPVVIVSNDGFNVVPTWRSIIVVPITTSSVQRQRAPTVVPLSSVGIGLKDNSAAVCHQITTIDRSKLDSRIGSLHPPDIRSIEHGIIAACDLPM